MERILIDKTSMNGIDNDKYESYCFLAGTIKMTRAEAELLVSTMSAQDLAFNIDFIQRNIKSGTPFLRTQKQKIKFAKDVLEKNIRGGSYSMIDLLYKIKK